MPAPGAGDLAGRHRARHDGERAPRSAASRHPSNDAARPSRARTAPRTTRPISANSPKTSNDLEKFLPWSDLDPVYFDSSFDDPLARSTPDRFPTLSGPGGDCHGIVHPAVRRSAGLRLPLLRPYSHLRQLRKLTKPTLTPTGPCAAIVELLLSTILQARI